MGVLQNVGGIIFYFLQRVRCVPMTVSAQSTRRGRRAMTIELPISIHSQNICGTDFDFWKYRKIHLTKTKKKREIVIKQRYADTKRLRTVTTNGRTKDRLFPFDDSNTAVSYENETNIIIPEMQKQMIIDEILPRNRNIAHDSNVNHTMNEFENIQIDDNNRSQIDTEVSLVNNQLNIGTQSGDTSSVVAVYENNQMSNNIQFENPPINIIQNEVVQPVFGVQGENSQLVPNNQLSDVAEFEKILSDFNGFAHIHPIENSGNKCFPQFQNDDNCLFFYFYLGFDEEIAKIIEELDQADNIPSTSAGISNMQNSNLTNELNNLYDLPSTSNGIYHLESSSSYPNENHLRNVSPMLNNGGNLTPNMLIHDAESVFYANPDMPFESELCLDFDFGSDFDFDFDFSNLDENL